MISKTFFSWKNLFELLKLSREFRLVLISNIIAKAYSEPYQLTTMVRFAKTDNG